MQTINQSVHESTHPMIIISNTTATSQNTAQLDISMNQPTNVLIIIYHNMILYKHIIPKVSQTYPHPLSPAKSHGCSTAARWVEAWGRRPRASRCNPLPPAEAFPNQNTRHLGKSPFPPILEIVESNQVSKKNKHKDLEEVESGYSYPRKNDFCESKGWMSYIFWMC